VRVGVLYGGRSGEHEVSVVSAASVFRHLDRSRYDPVPIRIARDGRWVLGAVEPTALSAADVREEPAGGALQPAEPTAAVTGGIDVVFPVLHGTYGEDGTVQGLLELADVPYVGSGVLGSAVAMDKALAKTVLAAHDLPVVPWITVRDGEGSTPAEALAARVASELGFPAFVKPANLGSSVGVSKVATPDGLAAALALAFEFDPKVLVEAAVPRAREIECAVLGNETPEASLPGEIVVTHADGFYSYDAKYLDPDGATTHVPAALSADTTARVQSLSVRAFQALELSGMARVDFFLDEQGALYLNEVNTIPGFTAISMYPKMWEASGVPYAALLDRLLQLAIDRHARRRRLRTSRA